VKERNSGSSKNLGKAMKTKKIIFAAFMISIATLAYANEIYIEQVGDRLDLDITQDGQNNEFGDSVADAVLTGDDMAFNVTQTGDTNKIDATIKGNNYTGTWVFTGNSNDVELTCSTTSGTNCENVRLDITTVGSNNIFDVFIGETADAQNLIAAFTITGDGSVIQAEVNGSNADITVTMNNSSTTSSATLNDAGSGNSTEAGGNMLDINISGDGDVAGNEVILSVTGGGNNLGITQSGLYDNKVDLQMTGDDGDVQINQSD
jgi:hypothetical protein|tara:strand:- start:265 stop:1050 length:786 start_codon:yes stop_codon:yes gene_type:complete